MATHGTDGAGEISTANDTVLSIDIEDFEGESSNPDTVLSIQDVDGGRSRLKDWPWVQSITDELVELKFRSRSKPKRNNCTMFRVPEQLREVNPKLYTPTEISLGLFNRKPIHAAKTRGDQLRLDLACKFLELVGKRNNITHEWVNVCKWVVPEPTKTQDLYDEMGRDPLSLKEVQSVLTLDAIFLTCFLASRTTPTRLQRLDQQFQALKAPLKGLLALITKDTSIGTNLSIEHDIIMVENQIPFELIQNVVHILFGKSKQDEATFLRGICVNFMRLLEVGLPGFLSDDDSKVYKMPADPYYFNFSKFDNMLDCGYHWLVHDPNTPQATPEAAESLESASEPPSEIPSVTQLQNAGIVFKGSREGFHHAQFKWGLLKATLYLPILAIDDKSELLWRNVLAFEQMQLLNDRKDHNEYDHFGSLIDFLGNLIDKESDVLSLAKGDEKVVAKSQLENFEQVVQLFNNKLIRHCTIYTKWGNIKKEVHNYFDCTLRRRGHEYWRRVTPKPEQYLYIYISILGLLLTFATLFQALYTIKGYYRGGRKNDSNSLSEYM